MRIGHMSMVKIIGPFFNAKKYVFSFVPPEDKNLTTLPHPYISFSFIPEIKYMRKVSYT